jgi:hypothetical protein
MVGIQDEPTADEGSSVPRDEVPELPELPEQSLGRPNRDCERCGRSTYYADGTWWHVVSGTVDCPDVSQLWAVQPNWFG